MRTAGIFLLTVVLLLFWSLSLRGQRQYRQHSVLATGNWYKIGVTAPGIYKIDHLLLAQLGITDAAPASGSIRVFGRSGAMLPEALTPGNYIDDLPEVAVQVFDGNDGVLNAGDRILFYAPGPHQWLYDSLSGAYRHQLNLYSDTAWYYINISPGGKKVQLQQPPASHVFEINTYEWRYFAETDTFNLLSSGKSWFGAEFSHAPGKTPVHTYPLPRLPRLTGAQGLLRYRMVARSFGVASGFSIYHMDSRISQLEIPPVATGPYDLFAREANIDQPINGNLTTAGLQWRYENGSANAQGWIDWFELLLPAHLEKQAGQLHFRNTTQFSRGENARFTIGHAGAELLIWDVSNSLEPVQMRAEAGQGGWSFRNDCSIVREYVAAGPDDFLVPHPAGRIANQDLHGLPQTSYLIITHPVFRGEANRLAAFHESRGLSVQVINTDAVYNEFSGGIADPSAIRDLVKMFYDRAGTDSSARPAYLLLLGAGSFDYKYRLTGNTNLVPVYESAASLDPLSTYTADDYFGFLEDGEDINTGTPDLDIAIGRIPAVRPEHAASVVNKILHYHQPVTLGAWRNNLLFIADDEDQNLHLEDAEEISRTAATAAPQMDIRKLYLDAFPQQSSPSGNRYPLATQEMTNMVRNGTLIWNYNGHGGNRRLAEEVILDQQLINGFKNTDKLPLFIVATCDFAPYDNPLVASIGEDLLLREKSGAIALMSTSRLVFASSNRELNKVYMDIALQPDSNGRYRSLGEASREAKNYSYRILGDQLNNRKFTLLGDPALTLAFPENRIAITAVNDREPEADTLRALDRVKIRGEVRDIHGEKLAGFNGTVFPVIYDKPAMTATIGNDPTSIAVQYPEQRNRLYRGKAAVRGGEFSLEFIVPRDIRYAYGAGKMQFYAEDGHTDARGMQEIIIGGSGDSTSDTEGPQVQAFLNDEQFISGGIVNEQPVLLVKLRDSSGINISGIGLGHDLVAILDNDPDKQFILNEYYEADENDFTRGVVRYQLPSLEPGIHSLTIKAWDVANNAGSANLDFRIVEDEHLVLKNVLNYPNPFTTRTNFWFDHNRAGDNLTIHIQVFTVTGKLVKTLHQTIFASGNRSNEVFWDGRDDFGQKLARGVYVYTVTVRSSDGRQARKVEKLYLL